MANEVLKRDENHVTALGGITNDSNEEIRMLRVDPVTGRLLISGEVDGLVEFNVLNYGAVGDGYMVDYVYVNSGSATLTTSRGQFTQADVGKVIVVFSDLTFGERFVSTIASVESATSITLSGNSTITTIFSTGWACYGTDDYQAFADAFADADDYFQLWQANDANIPTGGGQPIVFVPQGNNYGIYIIGSKINIPVGCGITAPGAKLVNAISGATDFIIQTAENPLIDELYLVNCWGGGISIGSQSVSTGGQTHSRARKLEVWWTMGDAIQLNGYGHEIGDVIVKRAELGMHFRNGSDTTCNSVFIIGSIDGVRFEATNQVRMPTLFLDSCGNNDGSGNTGCIIFANQSSRACTDIFIDFQCFTLSGLTRPITYVVNFLDTNPSQKNNFIRLRGMVNNSGGTLLKLAQCQETDITIDGSNYVGPTHANQPILLGVEYGSGNAGYNRVNLNLAAGVTKYSGTLYPGFFCFQSSVQYIAESIAFDTAVGSENMRMLDRKPVRFYDSDSTNYIGLRSPSTVASNVTFDLPSADGTANRPLVTSGSSVLSFSEFPMFSTLVEANTAGSGSPNIITSAESRTLFTNEGASALNYHTLPTAAAGLTYTFYVDDADGIRVTANTGDIIQINGVASSSAGYAECLAIGGSITLTAINATDWVATSVIGAWTLA